MLLANSDGFGIPDARLNLADVGTAHHKHTKSGLTDTSADRERKLVGKKHLVEGEISSFVAARDGELTVERFAVYTYSH